MSFEIVGKVKLLQDPQTFNSGFTKREFVITVEDGKYPQDICFECVQEKVSLLDSVNAGDELRVSFDIRCREYNGRYFNNLQAWRIQNQAGGAPQQDGPPQA
ncbi:MAG: DUF3127 domain-containing protein, partial [Verrucomicrobiota bacterium]